MGGYQKRKDVRRGSGEGVEKKWLMSRSNVDKGGDKKKRTNQLIEIHNFVVRVLLG